MADYFNTGNHASNLPDCFKKDKASNNYKILETEKATCNMIREELYTVDKILDINQAKGKALDMYGERVGQPRGVAEDDKYLLLIKVKLMRNLANGTNNSIVNALSSVLNCSPEQIVFTEYNNLSCKVKLESIPLSLINETGLTTSQLTAIINSLLPVGVVLEELEYTGTFMFSNIEFDYDEEGEEHGFENGYFGMVQGDEQDKILPI